MLKKANKKNREFNTFYLLFNFHFIKLCLINYRKEKYLRKTLLGEV